MDNWLKPYIEKLQNIFEINEYDQFVTELYEILRSKEYPNDIIIQVRKRATYLKNRFSDEVNKENMLMAKINLTDYLFALKKCLPWGTSLRGAGSPIDIIIYAINKKFNVKNNK